jgi:membrane protein implicated in regulation of membrane protease activity
VSRTARIVLVGIGAVAVLGFWIEVLIRNPTAAAVFAALASGFLAWYRRRRLLQVRKERARLRDG